MYKYNIQTNNAHVAIYENWGYIPYQEYSKIQLTGKQAPGSY